MSLRELTIHKRALLLLPPAPFSRLCCPARSPHDIVRFQRRVCPRAGGDIVSPACFILLVYGCIGLLYCSRVGFMKRCRVLTAMRQERELRCSSTRANWEVFVTCSSWMRQGPRRCTPLGYESCYPVFRCWPSAVRFIRCWSRSLCKVFVSRSCGKSFLWRTISIRDDLAMSSKTRWIFIV